MGIHDYLAITLNFPLGRIFQSMMNVVNDFLIEVVDAILFLWPSTPEGLSFTSILNDAMGDNPLGSGVVAEIGQTVLGMAAIVVAIKIYKLIPLKST